jgi:homoserine kinase
MRVTVRVPATSANLGPGFDSFGLALGVYDEVTAEVAGSGLRLHIDGEGAGGLPTDESNLVASSMRAAFDLLGGQPPGLSLHCRNTIPQGRGMGSSAAAIVAGIQAARSLRRNGYDSLDDATTLSLAVELEGHADNVAACLFGGFTITWAEGSATRWIRLEPHPDVVPVMFVAPAPLSTQTARALLPATVPHADAAANAARAALLAVAITSSPDQLLDATVDRLHQSYREPAMPDSHHLLRRLRDDGVAAVVSGAGPSILALTWPGLESAVCAKAPAGWRAEVTGIDRAGANQR